jgi:hypothetical protein
MCIAWLAAAASEGEGLAPPAEGDMERLEKRPDEGDMNSEWQAGVFRADRPAVREMLRSGRAGMQKRRWWVVRNSSARTSHRLGEKYVWRVSRGR